MVDKMENVICPQCGIIYFTLPQKRYVQCLDCGSWYYQAIRTENVLKWVGDAFERVKG